MQRFDTLKGLATITATLAFGAGAAFAQQDASDPTAWRDLDPENTLYMELETGRVVIELAPQFAPNHVAHMKRLARDGFFDNRDFYRVIEGFVAQGGAGDDVSEEGTPDNLTVDAELVLEDGSTLNFTLADQGDPFASETGFVDGFPTGRNAENGQAWMLHCPRAIAMARGADINAAGTDFYIVIGHGTRYLDRNLTVFGRVVYGQRYVQKVPRGERAPDGTNTGMIADAEQRAKILSVKVAADVAEDERTPVQLMRTDSEAFSAYLDGRRNREGEWWHVTPPPFLDACVVPMPTRLAGAAEAADSDD